ncbi:hypothetical protein CMO96_03575 [Candidatus Woesebacteria bacterium]|nr:hypothetical protein [Candidatus Woesebacteria bacterium]
MNKWLKIVVFSTLASFFLLLPKTTQAAVRCEAQYGGGEVCVKTGELQIDKEVWDSQGRKFVDNLGITSHKFAPGDEITFRLKIKNVGDDNLDKVDVTDSLPSQLTLVSGSTSFEIKDLGVGKSEEREIKVKVSQDALPSDKSLICIVNTAEVRSGDNHDRDTSQVCLEKKVGKKVEPKALPEAGAENWLIAFGSLFVLAIGMYLVRFRIR